MSELRFAIVTSSDSCAKGERDDLSGRALTELVEARGWSVCNYHVCPDDRESLTASLIEMADLDGADVILTTGGTGFGPRDVTPEATIAACERLAPGIAEHIRAQSMMVTPRAMLARGVCGLRGHTLIINLPGSEKAVRESFSFVVDQLEHAVKMIGGGGHD
ncbi:MAG: MogA/MoaB family molybdenum cofactor biosynthesis protein [Coriobacteriia bacterium]|nr:MogA/MoaB family molybdenum cofactor biosynthesis protein [Coriobacteriia bacterium]